MTDRNLDLVALVEQNLRMSEVNRLPIAVTRAVPPRARLMPQSIFGVVQPTRLSVSTPVARMMIRSQRDGGKPP
ncbi:MAG: hypothetical protein JWQ68_2552 [Cryobacterium sp.]|jgi:hypothetical protein|nr:hypothetical protein [Cryobacterium sp.]